MSMYSAIKENRKFYLSAAVLAGAFWILMRVGETITDAKFTALCDLITWAVGLFCGANVAEKIGAGIGNKKNESTEKEKPAV